MLLLAGLLTAQQAVADVAVNATNFPDPEMIRWLSEYIDLDHDDIINDEEIAAVTWVNFSTDYGWNISSFKGIEYFTAIESFEFYNNAVVTTLDLSTQESLHYINICNNSKLESIKLSQNAHVENAQLYGNPSLTTIDWSDKASFKEINLEGDINIKGFSFTDFTALESFNIQGCTSWGDTIDISGLRPKYVYFAETGIKTLIARQNAVWWWWAWSGTEQVKHLDISNDLSDPKSNDNRYDEINGELNGWLMLETLDITNNVELRRLNVACENLKSIKMDNCPKLIDLRIGHTRVPEFDVAAKLPNLEYLYLDRQDEYARAEWAWKKLDVSKLIHLKELNIYNNMLTYLNLEDNKEMYYEYGLWEQYPDFQLVQLSANEVGIAVDKAFKGEKLTYLKVNETELTPKMTTVDGQQYFVVWNNAATAQSLVGKDKAIYYHYTVGFVPDADSHLQVSGTATSVIKCPSFLTLSATTVNGVYGGTVTAPTVTRSQGYEGQLTFVSSNPQVVTVTADGKLTVVGAGTATITVSGSETTYRQAPAAKTYTVVIAKASPKFAFANATVETVAQDAVPANALDKGIYDGTVKYSSSNEAVAKVDANGKVTTLKGGTVTITAAGEETANCNKPTAATYTLTVKKRAATITLAATTVNGVYGGQITAPKATVTNGFDGNLTYASSDETVVKADNTGKLTITGAGEATVTVSSTETAVYSVAAPVSFKVIIAKATPEFSFEQSEMEGDAETELEDNELQTSVYDGKVVYTSSDTKIATVDANTGKVTMKMGGTVTITATGEATKNCNAAKASYTLTVYSKGDVNHDKAVDVADIASIISAMADSADPIIAGAADVNHDKAVDVADIASVISIMAANARRMGLKVE